MATYSLEQLVEQLKLHEFTTNGVELHLGMMPYDDSTTIRALCLPTGARRIISRVPGFSQTVMVFTRELTDTPILDQCIAEIQRGLASSDIGVKKYGFFLHSINGRFMRYAKVTA